MTEPTDDELDAVIAEYQTRIYPQDMQPRFERAIMRAAIAKWGTPSAVAGEPYGYVYTVQVAPIVGDERKVERTVFTRNKPPCDALALYTTPQPTQAQAGAVPLNHKNIEPVRRFLADRGIYLSDETTKALITVAHGIKGGQHGSE